MNIIRYNFQPIQRYKALSAEEAEQEFSRRNKFVNYFSLMVRKRLRNDEDGADDEELIEGGKSRRPNKKEKDLKISEMDEWMDSDDDDSDSDEDENKKGSADEDDAKKKKGKGNKENNYHLCYKYVLRKKITYRIKCTFIYM